MPEPEIENELEDLSFRQATRLGVTEVWNTLVEMKRFRTLFLYMLAYFFFIDGINSVTSLAGAFGVTVLGLTVTDLIMTIVAIQFVAFPAAFFFTWLAERKSTKTALQISLVVWCVAIVGAMGFAPLELDAPKAYDLRFEAMDEGENYTLVTLAEEPFGSSDEDQALQANWQHLLDGGNVSQTSATALVMDLEDTRFSAWLSEEVHVVGIDHPTNLGDGELDFIPAWTRSTVWEPLGMSVFWQWLFLGCLVGVLMGGSQGLARSLFGQIVPETRSTEFFGFFGFFGKVAAFIGPLVYGILAVAFDSRVAIASLAVLIIVGTVMLVFVDVEDGIAVAAAEDARIRGLSDAEE